MTTQTILLIVAGIGAIVLYALYASIIKRRNKALEALSGIDVQLKQRADLIPNVLELAKKFMAHEKTLLEEITQLRTDVQKMEKTPAEQRDIKGHFDLENILGNRMGQLMVAVENYPDLKSQAPMMEAQQTYREVEDNIAASRRFYNAAVNELRNIIEIFPGNIIAGVIGVKTMPFFEADDSSKKPVSVKDHM